MFNSHNMKEYREKTMGRRMKKTPSNHKESLPAVRRSTLPQQTFTSINVGVSGKYFCSRSIFIASLLLVLSAGGFPRSSRNDSCSCRSYSEALATTFYSQGLRRTHSTLMSRGFVRGGSSSIFSSGKEDTAEDDVNLENNILVSNTNKNMVGNTTPMKNNSRNGSTVASATTSAAANSSNIKANGTTKMATNISIQKNGVEKLNSLGDQEEKDMNYVGGKVSRNNKGRALTRETPVDCRLVEADQHIATKHVAETNLPTDIGHFRLRAYRVEEKMQELLQNEHFGTEPCVIYATHKPPFGQEAVPVRIHDQCFTSEVFRSQRYVCRVSLECSNVYVCVWLCLCVHLHMCRIASLFFLTMAFVLCICLFDLKHIYVDATARNS